MRNASVRRAMIVTAALATLLSSGAPTRAAGPPLVGETPAQHDARMAWWREARFGMFIHWGLYAIPAGVYKNQTDHAEWFLETTHMPVSEYEKFVPRFNPVKFNAEEWVKIARNAGMKYIVITSKHHDGFGLFPSRLTDWCIKSTPFGRDPLKELAEACKEQGIRFCTYHSIMDWHHPDWGIRRPWNDRATGTPDMNRFNEYLKGQVTEIVKNYDPGVMWFDGQWEKPWTEERSRDMYAYLRGLDPDLIINNRVGGGYGDFGTPEQTIPATGLGKGVDWESCMTLNDHWGYNSHDKHWKSVQTIIHNLVDCASKGGNYLLNVGPTAEGLIPAESVERLAKVGDWMKHNGASIYGTSASPFKSLPWGRCTRNGSKLYLHVFHRPADGVLIVPMTSAPAGVRLLADPTTPLPFTARADGVRITLPATLPDPDDTVIVAEVQGEIQPIAMSIQPARDGSFKLLAQDADLTGGVQVEGDPPNLGYWTTAEGTAAWPLSVDHPGSFAVTLEYSLDPASPGSEYVLTLGGHSLTGKLAVTKGWHDYTKIKAGAIAAPEGRTVLTIKPAKQPAIGLMNLRSITLTPEGN
jgi:alpha-L-fucosidase